jgi:hypothetical protein
MQLITQSRIEGEFEGFDGDRIYTLDNGQQWQQAHYKYRYVYKYRPVARIWNDGGKYTLDVEGMGEIIQVRRM